METFNRLLLFLFTASCQYYNPSFILTKIRKENIFCIILTNEDVPKRSINQIYD